MRGTGLLPGLSRVEWNGVELSGAMCTAAAAPALASCVVTVPAANVASRTTAAITVVNPSSGPAPFTSNRAYLTVTTVLQPDFTELPMTTSVGANPRGVTIGDFNRDGALDVVTDNSDSLSVVLGDGAGRLTAGQSIALPGFQRHNLVTADVDEDGILDLVGGCPSIQAFPGNGDGTFRIGSITDVRACEQIVIGDFNRDDHLDIVAPGTESINASFVSVIRVLLGDGTGRFTQSDSLADTTLATFQSVAAGDFDGDGGLDVALVRSALQQFLPGTLRILSVDSQGLLTERSSTLTGTDAEIVTPADFNGDGILDLVVNSRSPISAIWVYLGDGLGDFTLMPLSPINTGLLGANRAEAADIDGDGSRMSSSKAAAIRLATARSSSFEATVRADSPAASTTWRTSSQRSISPT